MNKGNETESRLRSAPLRSTSDIGVTPALGEIRQDEPGRRSLVLLPNPSDIDLDRTYDAKMPISSGPTTLKMNRAPMPPSNRATSISSGPTTSSASPYNYRGQGYCTADCRKLEQSALRRRTNAKHQRSEEGRQDHAEQQRALRTRKRAKAQAVTDVSRQKVAPRAEWLAPADPIPLAVSAPEADGNTDADEVPGSDSPVSDEDAGARHRNDLPKLPQYLPRPLTAQADRELQHRLANANERKSSRSPVVTSAETPAAVEG